MNTDKFEIPEQLKELAKQNVENASTAYEQFMDAMTNAMEMWAKALPSSAATENFKSVQELSIRFTKENSEAALAHGKRLASANSLTEITTLQSEFARSQMAKFTAQSQEFGQLVLKAADQR